MTKNTTTSGCSQTPQGDAPALCEIAVPDPFGGAEHRVFVHDATAAQFASRLAKVARERRKWARREGVFCYRVYDADLPDYAVAIDIYTEVGEQESEEDVEALGRGFIARRDTPPERGNLYAYIAEYQAPAEIDAARAAARFDDVVTIAPVVLGVSPQRVFTKVRRRDKGGAQYADAGSVSHVFTTYEPSLEHGILLQVDLGGYLDTGLFLDHRVTRRLCARIVRDKFHARHAQAAENPAALVIAALVASVSAPVPPAPALHPLPPQVYALFTLPSCTVRFLNLFAYTGSATVHAAAAGAMTTTVDLSQTYLDWAARNMASNNHDGHEFVRSDTRSFLERAAREGRMWDVVFVDPPTFSNSKAMGTRTWDVQRDHVELLRAVRAVMAPGGQCIFSCNLRSFKPDTAALAKAGIVLRDITAETIPDDFCRNPKIHCCYMFS